MNNQEKFEKVWKLTKEAMDLAKDLGVRMDVQFSELHNADVPAKVINEIMNYGE